MFVCIIRGNIADCSCMFSAKRNRNKRDEKPTTRRMSEIECGVWNEYGIVFVCRLGKVTDTKCVMCTQHTHTKNVRINKHGDDVREI